MATNKKVSVTFKGNASQYNKTLKNMERQTRSTMRKLEGHQRTLTRAFTAGAAAIGGMIGLYRQREQAEIGVAAAIRQTGRANEFSLVSVRKMVDGMRETTTATRAQATETAKFGILLADMSNKQLPGFMQVVADYAITTNKSQQEAALQMAKVFKVPERGLAKLTELDIDLTAAQKERVQSLIDLGKHTEAQNALMAEVGGIYAQQAAAAREGTGQLVLLKNAFIDISDRVGELIFKWLEPLIKTMVEWAQVLSNDEDALVSMAYWLKRVTLSLGALLALVSTMYVFTKAKLFILGFVSAVKGATTVAGVAKLAFKAMWGALLLGIVFLPELLELFGVKMPSTIKGAVLQAEIWFKQLINWFRGLYLDMLEIINDNPLGDALVDDNYLAQVRQEAENTNAELRRLKHNLKEVEDAAAAEEKDPLAEYREQQEKLKEEKGKVRDEEAEEKLRQMDEDLSLERMRLEGLEEERIAAEERKVENARAWREIEKLEDEGKMELADRMSEMQLIKEKKQEKATADKKKKADKDLETERIQSLKDLSDFLGRETAIGKTFHLAWKALKIKKAIISTYEAATTSFNRHGGWPWGLIPAAATVAKGLAMVQQIRAAQEGGMVHGNPSYGDAYPYLLQAGETVVPRQNYAQLEQDIIRRAGGQTDDAGTEIMASVDVDLTGDAGKLFQVNEQRVEALAV